MAIRFPGLAMAQQKKKAWPCCSCVCQGVSQVGGLDGMWRKLSADSKSHPATIPSSCDNGVELQLSVGCSPQNSAVRSLFFVSIADEPTMIY